MICCEILTIYFFYPETQGRTLEELAFCEFFCLVRGGVLTDAVFEDESFADRVTMAVEKQIHQGGDGPVEIVEEVGAEKGEVLEGEVGKKTVV